MEGERIVATHTHRSDGTWTRDRWDARRQPATEALGWHEREAAMFEYERDPRTHALKAVTLTCTDRQGLQRRHPAGVGTHTDDELKRNLLRTHCSGAPW